MIGNGLDQLMETPYGNKYAYKHNQLVATKTKLKILTTFLLFGGHFWKCQGHKGKQMFFHKVQRYSFMLIYELLDIYL